MRKPSFIHSLLIVLVIGSMLIALAFGTHFIRQLKQLGERKYIDENKQITSFPGEFEKQQAIWMQWPSGIYNADAHPVNPAMIRIIKSLASYIRVNLISQNEEEIEQIKNLLMISGFTGNNVHYYTVNHFSIWARDVGPIFVKDNLHQLRVVDFGFNNYSRDGEQSYIQIEGQVDRLTAQLLGLPVIKANLISEGGAIESNGRGTMMVTESVALVRNPEMTKQQIESEYKRVLGVKKVIWLSKGLAEDDRITRGHINEIARFTDPHTVLLAQVLPEDRHMNRYAEDSFLRMEENNNILLNSTDQDGKPFRIIRIPMPPTLYSETSDTGELPVRSYLNYAVTNGAVLLQTYWKPGRSEILKTVEEQVKEIFRSVYPGRKIIGIDAESINLWGGGIHCVTQHMPAE
ncbi:MAG: agmatine deiminase family protein [Bacillota bacterium]